MFGIQILTRLHQILDRCNHKIGSAVAWLALGMLLVQFVVVVQRYVFSIGSLFMQESIVYMHGFLIMLGGGYTLLYNEHVRVDIFYRSASQHYKNLINLWGSLLFLLPVCGIIWWSAWPNVELSWRNLEGSTETSGIPVKYLLKSSVLLFALLLGLQGVSTAIKSWLRLKGIEVFDPYVTDDSS